MGVVVVALLYFAVYLHLPVGGQYNAYIIASGPGFGLFWFFCMQHGRRSSALDECSSPICAAEDRNAPEPPARNPSRALAETPSIWAAQEALGDDVYDEAAATRGHYPEPRADRRKIPIGPIVTRDRVHEAAVRRSAEETRLGRRRG